MSLPEEAYLLRVHCGESDRHGGVSLYEAIVRKARELHMAGATVLKGSMGFGAASRIHTARVLALSEDLPMVVEIVESREKIDELLPHLEEMMGGGLVTLEKVQVLHYHSERHSEHHSEHAKPVGSG
jgi:PII-like signaling protein